MYLQPKKTAYQLKKYSKVSENGKAEGNFGVLRIYILNCDKKIEKSQNERRNNK